jgi:hypothetical protein
MDTKKQYVEEEALIVRYSGEIPEVAFHGSVYFLTTDPEGPEIQLDPNDLLHLKKIVVDRYCEIIRRDLNPDNLDKSIYRGLARSYANWMRLTKFCSRENLRIKEIRTEMASLLKQFLHNEAKEVAAAKRETCINLSVTLLGKFSSELGLSLKELPENITSLCPPASE